MISNPFEYNKDKEKSCDFFLDVNLFGTKMN